MRGLGFATLGLILAAALWLWGFGGAQQISTWAADGQREVQQAMAGYLRALKRGDVHAFLGLMGLCFSYGFFHAIGPGHGKLVIGGYGLASKIDRTRLAALAVASSLAQAATAVLLVLAGTIFLGWGRAAVTDTADKWLAPVSTAAIALVGMWLALRALRMLQSQRRALQDHHHHHVHDHEGLCSTCGHAHGPTPEQAANVHSLKDAAAIIAAVAIRPCTGALFLLIITWSMGIFAAGIAGAFVMALGTASVTVLVAFASATFRARLVASLEGTAGMLTLAAWLQLLVGLGIAALATQMTLAAM